MSGHADQLQRRNLIEPDQLRARLSRLLPKVAPSFIGGADTQVEVRLAQARAAFLHGYHETLNAASDALPRLLEREPPHRRGFALEGAGMASVMLDALVGGTGRVLGALLDGRSEADETLIAIGVGWANARLHQPPYRLPRGIHLRHLGAVIDGYGFHQGFFHPVRFEGRGFPAREGKMEASYDAGLGRALWFVYAGRAEPILRAVNKMTPQRRPFLWRGVGTACAFTGCTFSARDFALEVFSGIASTHDLQPDGAKLSDVRIRPAAAQCEHYFREGLKAGNQLLCALGPHREEIPL